MSVLPLVVVVSTQLLAVSAGQEHTLFTQAAPVGQTVPHPPQLFGSFAVSTHKLPHNTEPPRHSTPHWPIEQTWPAGQAWPHPPQLFGSFFSSAQ